MNDTCAEVSAVNVIAISSAAAVTTRPVQSHHSRRISRAMRACSLKPRRGGQCRRGGRPSSDGVTSRVNVAIQPLLLAAAAPAAAASSPSNEGAAADAAAVPSMTSCSEMTASGGETSSAARAVVSGSAPRLGQENP